MITPAAIATAPGQPFAVRPVSIERPREGEVLVRIVGVGLCHTDIIFRDQFVPYPLPAVLGHEGAGVIEALGDGVDGLAVGDKVVLGFSSCGECARCGENLPSYCSRFPQLNYAGVRIEDGSTALADGERSIASHFFGQSSFAGHAVVRARNVVKIDDDALPLELLGPLGCGFQTGAGAVLRSMDCPADASLVVLGGGPVGLAAIMAGKIRGCSPIILVEPFQKRRSLAEELGATHAIDSGNADLTIAIRGVLADGADFALDCTGRIEVIEAAMAALAPRGMLGLVGVPSQADESIALNVAGAITYGQRIIGIMEGDSDPRSFIPELVEYFRDGRFPIDRLIETFPLDQINEAILRQAEGEIVKVVLIP